MPNEDNLIEFPTQSEPSLPAPITTTYHYAGFRIAKSGQSTWFDGIVSLESPIVHQTQYENLKKLLAEHYDMPESNLIITNLAVIDKVA